MRNPAFLVGKKAIADYMHLTEKTLPAFLDLGLPAAKINGRWYAHTENVDSFFKRLTKKKVS